ncbi:hypothetical protein ZYGR_0BB01340 [Zygosaccharomyces rouxii]|uniref:Peptide hydrolase n=1 Tax=Zygosaccharomyces rouxii TaxID=4956 RepID=A0A1Q3AKS1_ZYGRO|nr:hypothetical protein ZYGR_0BB01340 [Zygosaccharomyces rouxii]
MKLPLSTVSASCVLAASIGHAFVIPATFETAFAPSEAENAKPHNVEEAYEGYLESLANMEGLDVNVENFPRPHIPYFLKPLVETEKLQSKISVDDLNSTAIDLFHIANSSVEKYGHPTRVIGSEGHWNTLDYILEQFEQMKDYYTTETQNFTALSGKIRSFNLSDAKTGETFANTTAFALSPPVKEFVGELVEIPNLGCNPEDYEAASPKKHQGKGKGKKHHGGFWPWSKNPEKEVEPFMQNDDEKTKHGCHGKGKAPHQKIALIERGQCPFGDKAELAGKHGYHAVIIYDSDPDSEGGLHGTLGNPTNHSVSTLGVTFSTGQELSRRVAQNKHYSLRFAMDSYIKQIKTTNVIADTKHGDPNNIVVLGAHSDSVEEGPGINDDGSGTISLLTVAKQLTHFKINNKVRFAWWAAEEEGLLGSIYYADNLSKEENEKIRVFMDYDMMASPNYEYEIYDANNRDSPVGSEELRDLYINYYKSRGLNYTLVPFDGRSDYVGFINHGIPAGGIAAGAEKSNVFRGGVLDRCYHQLCDDLTNLAWDAFLVNTQLIAHSVATYANSFAGFPERVVNNNTEWAYAQKAAPQTPLFPYRGDNLII